LFGDTLYPIAKLCAVIERHAVFDASLVIINEETRWNKIAQFLFLAIELDGRGDCIGGTGTDLALIVNPRAMPAQIGFRRKYTQLGQRRGVKMITIIGKVWHPAEPETAILSSYFFHSLRLES